MKKIIIKSGDIHVMAELNDSNTARAVYDILPLVASANVWGDEIYFNIPVRIEQAPDAKQLVDVGDLAFWPVGAAFCIFFGPTPVSSDEQPKAYSPVNVFGRITGDAKIFKQVSDGDRVEVIKAD